MTQVSMDYSVTSKQLNVPQWGGNISRCIRDNMSILGQWMAEYDQLHDQLLQSTLARSS